MKKYLVSIVNKELGAIGIGAMIVFIAMVLVAGIAASVFVQTSNKLESQALKSGQETTAEVSIGLAVEDIYGHKSGNSIDEIAVAIRPRAGSDNIDLSETVIEISDSSKKNILVFSGAKFGNTTDIDGDIFALAAFDASSTEFRVVVLEDADGSCSSSTPVIGSGDHVFLCIDVGNVFSSLTANTDVSGMVILEEGAPAPFVFSIPGLSGDTTFDLY